MDGDAAGVRSRTDGLELGGEGKFSKVQLSYLTCCSEHRYFCGSLHLCIVFCNLVFANGAGNC